MIYWINLITTTLLNIIIACNVNLFIDNYTQLSMDNYFLLASYGIIVSTLFTITYIKLTNYKKIILLGFLSIIGFLIPYQHYHHYLLNNLHIFCSMSANILSIYIIVKYCFNNDLKLLKLTLIIVVIAIIPSLLKAQVLGISEFIISEWIALLPVLLKK